MVLSNRLDKVEAEAWILRCAQNDHKRTKRRRLLFEMVRVGRAAQKPFFRIGCKSMILGDRKPRVLFAQNQMFLVLAQDLPFAFGVQ